MKRLLNEHTGTLHKCRPGTSDDETACGALRHVPKQHVTPVADNELREGDGVDRCGRCFEGTGGY